MRKMILLICLSFCLSKNKEHNVLKTVWMEGVQKSVSKLESKKQSTLTMKKKKPTRPRVEDLIPDEGK
ncbi:MAG TPA: hypothetical protein DCF33_20085, partial [Saprospirales bacterium]|nr:hypothetical protein [Saprospirales bacterium]